MNLCFARVREFFLATVLLALVSLVSGCFSDDNNNNNNGNNNVSASSTSITGTAATGAAIDGFAYLRDALNTEINTAINPDGTFEFDTTGLQPPLIFRVVPNAGGQTEYSFSDVLDGIVNLSPLTTLATFIAANQVDLETIFQNWSTSTDAVSRQAIDDAVQTINTNLATKIQAMGLDPNTLDPVRTPFAVNGQGIDGLLDGIRVNFDFIAGNFEVQDAVNNFAPIAFSFGSGAGGGPGNPGGSGDSSGGTNSDTGGNGQGDDTDTGTGSDIGGGAAIGANSIWKLTISGTSTTNGITVNIPEVVLNNLPGSDVPLNEAELNADDLVNSAQAAGQDITATVTESSVDSSGYDGTPGSKILIHLAGNLQTTVQGFSVNNDFDYNYVYELISN